MKFAFTYHDVVPTIRLEAETAQEASQLAKIGLNGNASTQEICDVYCSSESISLWIGLKMRKDRSTTNIRPHKP